ncbi:MAG: 50S ribosomal protein L15 [Candidatus Aminicenantes bacterium]|nr:50S ribosomal protein L15 [Candidatus Aminicenantes bacterium]MCK5005331.1 50S ribosomal protein L15 [Candidatus Aminicenantes bacterium]
MSLANLKPAKGSVKKRKRIGRGPGSGFGKTAGRGMNGQKSRSGYSRKRGFEGGQMPLIRRIPKRGFTNIFKVTYNVVNVGDIDKSGLDELNIEVLLENRMIRDKRLRLKILGDGELSRKVKVSAHKFSKTAIEKIEKSGGEVVVLTGEEN